VGRCAGAEESDRANARCPTFHPGLGAKYAPKMGHPDLWRRGEKQIPYGNDRKKSKNSDKDDMLWSDA
jgi:hypothetical protein